MLVSKFSATGAAATLATACSSGLLHASAYFSTATQDVTAHAPSSSSGPSSSSRIIDSNVSQDQAQTSQQPAGETIDFGFRTVARQEKESLVRQVFSNVAGSYDIMNDLMSGGLHRLWKDSLVDTLGPFHGMQHLDVAGGTGDVAFRVLRAIRAAEQQQQQQQQQVPSQQAPGQQQQQQPPQQVQGHVTVFDINAEMLEVGKRRAQEQGLSPGLSWVQGNAQELPFPDACMDAYTVAFGIRNMTDRDAALSEAYRVLKRGGRLLCLEFSHVSLPVLKQAYGLYSFSVIPKIGGLVAGDEGSYQYLVESIRQFPDQDSWAEQIRAAGFKAVTYENLTGGVVAIHSGFKL